MFKSANVGSVDRVIRIVAGAVLVALPFVASWGNSGAKFAAIAVGGVLIATALVRFCPLYRVIGTSTCSAPKS